MSWQIRADAEREKRRRERLRQTNQASLPARTNWARELGFEPDPYQDAALASEGPLILNWSRQSGKSTTVAYLATYDVTWFPGALVLLLSPTLRQSAELLRKVKGVLEIAALRHPDKGLELVEDNSLSVQLACGSRVVSLPDNPAGIRGYSAARLIIVDEAAFFNDSDASYRAVRPMLAVSRGRLVLCSTPFGKRGFFYREAWAAKQRGLVARAGGFGYMEYQATQNPRVTSEFLEEERLALGDIFYAQEYLCQFVDAVNALFSVEVVQRMLSPDIAPLFPGGLA